MSIESVDRHEPDVDLRRELVEAGVLVWRVRIAGGDIVVTDAGRPRLVDASFVPLGLADAVRARRDDVLCYLGAAAVDAEVILGVDAPVDDDVGLERLLAAFPGATLVEECDGST